MRYWHLPLFIGILCAVTACGTGSSTNETVAPAGEGAPTETSPEDSTPDADAATETETAPADDSTAAIATATEQADVDLTVIPGERVGPVTRDTSRAELADLYGEAALQDTEVPVGEGFTESGTRVNAGTETAFAVIWVDESQARPATVKDFGPAWQTPEGIHVGMPFSELQAQLGTFDLYGFGWDYQGTVVLEGSDLAGYYGQLILRLAPEASAIAQHPTEYQAVQGDVLLASENPNLPPLDLAVEQMIVYLNPPAQ